MGGIASYPFPEAIYFTLGSICMPRKSRPPPPDNPDQFKRFVETAREIETDKSPDAVDRAFQRVIRKPPQKQPEQPS
jgi:hypothetical protein